MADDPTTTPAPKRQPLGYARDGAHRAWRPWLVVGVVLCPLIGFALVPKLHSSRPGCGNVGKCASNIRQIGLGIEMYANDFGGALPPDAATILIIQDLTTEAFICPSSNDERATGATPADLARSFRTPGHCSYVYVAAPLKRRAAVTPAHVLAYENLQNHPADVHVLFGDGRAKSFPKAEAARLIAELQAGHNPPRPRK